MERRNLRERLPVRMTSELKRRIERDAREHPAYSMNAIIHTILERYYENLDAARAGQAAGITAAEVEAGR